MLLVSWCWLTVRFMVAFREAARHKAIYYTSLICGKSCMTRLFLNNMHTTDRKKYFLNIRQNARRCAVAVRSTGKMVQLMYSQTQRLCYCHTGTHRRLTKRHKPILKRSFTIAKVTVLLDLNTTCMPQLSSPTLSQQRLFLIHTAKSDY